MRRSAGDCRRAGCRRSADHSACRQAADGDCRSPSRAQDWAGGAVRAGVGVRSLARAPCYPWSAESSVPRHEERFGAEQAFVVPPLGGIFGYCDRGTLRAGVGVRSPALTRNLGYCRLLSQTIPPKGGTTSESRSLAIPFVPVVQQGITSPNIYKPVTPLRTPNTP